MSRCTRRPRSSTLALGARGALATLACGALLAACGGGKAAPPPRDPTVGTEPEKPSPEKAEPEVPEPPPATGTPKADLIPRGVLFGNPERAAVRISPDGKHLSWLAPKDGVLNIWVAPVGKLDQARAVTSDTKRPIRIYFWAYTSQHLLYMQDAGGDENFHVFRVDLADGKTTDLTPFPGARASVAGMSDRQPTTIVVQINDRKPEAMDLHKVDLLTGKRELLVQNDEGLLSFTLDHKLRARLATKKLPDGSTQLLAQDGKAWKLFDSIPFEDAETSDLVAFAPGDEAVYFTESRGRDTAALVLLDLKTKKQKVLAEDVKADSGDVIVHPTKHNLQAVSFEYDRQRWHVLDKSIERDLAALGKLDGGGGEAIISSRTLDDKWWIVITTSEQRPGRYYLWDRAKQQAAFLFSSRPELEKQPLVKMWPVQIKARDGLTLVSYLSLPAAADPDGDGTANAPVPMVLFVHGGPWARDSWGYNPAHQLFANRGYAVLSVNYRGSTGFGKKFLNAANLQWSKQMHDDLLDAVDWSVKTGVAPRDKICIAGGSYGGYATLVGLAMTPTVFKCGVDIVGPSNLLTLLASIPPYWAPFVAVFHTRMGDPKKPEGKALLEAASPLTHAKKIERPLLIAQGANDPRVKQAESEQIVAAMKQHGLPVTYALFPDEGHGFARPENNIAFFAITEAFLSAHMGGVYLPITKAELAASSMQIKEGRRGIPGLPN
ncbi:MAG TPA: S9 family peptidase [Kofleriaceae bacterium]|nr:S9 family peptidase [Kofleriaceae bacterium]